MEVNEVCLVTTSENTYNFNAACRHSLPTLKKFTNNIIADKYLQKYNEQAEETAFQGEFINLIQQEMSDVTWKPFIYSVPSEKIPIVQIRITQNLPNNLIFWLST